MYCFDFFIFALNILYGMKMGRFNTILFCFSGFKKENIRLQPWLTIYNVSMYCISKGYSVYVLTDGKSDNVIFENINIHFVKTLKQYNYSEIIKNIFDINPDVVFVSVTPFSLVFNLWYKILSNFKSYCFASYPFYKFENFKKIFFKISMIDKLKYGKHLLIPDRWWSYRVRKYFKGIIAQSDYTKNVIKKRTRNNISVYFLPPGLNTMNHKHIQNTAKSQKTRFIYAGSLKKIRGFEMIVQVFNKIKDQDVSLIILARGATKDQASELKEKFISGLVDVKIYGGWLSPDLVTDLISMADVMLLPFLLIPSEFPVTAMESIALGTPVIVSRVAGLPEFVCRAGLVVEQGSTSSLLQAVKEVHRDHKRLASMKEECFKQRNKYLGWDDVASLWIALMEGEK